MSEHTPGKLRVDVHKNILCDGGQMVAFPCISGGLNQEANARRLVACWNALEDLPQDALDGGWTRAGLEAYGLQMKAERDSLRAVNAGLLEALEGAASALAYAAFNLDGSKLEDLRPGIVDSTGAAETALIAERNSRAAIASARKQGGPT